MKDLFAAIYTRFAAAPGGIHNSFYTAVNGRLFNTAAPVDTPLPLATMTLTGNIVDQFMEKCKVQITLFSCTTSDTEILALYDAMTALYDNCDLPLLGHPSNLGMERVHTILFQDANVWQYVIEYEVWVERQ